MDLNRMGSGMELLQKMYKAGNLRKMGWSPEQQKAQADRRKNPYSSKPKDR